MLLKEKVVVMACLYKRSNNSNKTTQLYGLIQVRLQNSMHEGAGGGELGKEHQGLPNSILPRKPLLITIEPTNGNHSGG